MHHKGCWQDEEKTSGCGGGGGGFFVNIFDLDDDCNGASENSDLTLLNSDSNNNGLNFDQCEAKAKQGGYTYFAIRVRNSA